ncbi:tRNA (adenine(22)-N(1))-methyltransferase [Streptococcus macacae]|uniref:PF04816 family protein n=1 Tax=Streptococcus macacae NCTC 11558 TaxID=764298 RepID=G5JVN9_9STRE|nr:tRNA (adenine(22)-N(1))-methyltransferase TrmK [Streptococcus macacae]EHJ53075.1 hypothetical protein STRMA_0895 [Streptococcus macacae NCTC 11558]SUN78707.1 putative tRNA-m1A22 methylase [Streptococcus macacae NCTC 11558]
MLSKKKETVLSQRLQEVASFVPKGARLLDIGSDHAYLPIYLLREEKISFALAGEIAKGPYESALSNIAASELQDKIEVRLADGLAAFSEKDNIDLISICGMGGRLIVAILKADPVKLATVKQLILQPNNGEDELRFWLMANGFAIAAERIVADKGKYYEIIVAKNGHMSLSDKELRFGPFLKQELSPVFKERWQKELAKLESALTKIPQENTEEKLILQQKIDQIKEVLYESQPNH